MHVVEPISSVFTIAVVPVAEDSFEFDDSLESVASSETEPDDSMEDTSVVVACVESSDETDESEDQVEVSSTAVVVVCTESSAETDERNTPPVMISAI